jgi:uncharacterized membrane protein
MEQTEQGALERGLSAPRRALRKIAEQARATRRAHEAIDIARSVTVRADPQTVYETFRAPETFARMMHEFAQVHAGEGGRTRWTVHGPWQRDLTFETEVLEDKPGELMRWASVPDAAIALGGGLHLRPAPGDRGTEVRLQLRLTPPLGALGGALVKLLGPAPALVAERALRNLKTLIEAGELPSLHHNPAARASELT